MWHIWRFVLLKKMGIQGQSLQDLAECALLHDNAVAQYIQEELQNDALRNGVTKLGRHCTIGEKILKNIPFHNDVSNVILYPPMKTLMETSVYKGYKQDKIEMRGDRAEMSDFPLYLNTVAGGLDRRDQTIGGFSFVVKIYAVPVIEIIG